MTIRPQRKKWLMVSALTAGLLATSLPALASSLAGAADEVAAVPSSHYEQPGPHGVTKVQGGPNCTLYYPGNIGASGIQHPIMAWGNGTGATPDSYDAQLRHLATWGVVVAAANTTQAGSGQEMLACGKFVVAEDQRAGSVFHGRIDETKFGAAGHSQGGGGAIAAGADPIVTTTIPLQPGPQGTVSKLHGPSLFIAGQNDWIVPSFYVRSRYSQATQIPAIFAELRGSDHFFPGDTRIRLIGVLTAWSRFHLMGDEQARGIFFGPTATCGICNDSTAWSAVARNSKALVIPG
ncbi:acetylxylan esterase [Actinokineospora sp.]|uniref:poly(ethylene terephthalate) hydrolase family protein n=1 Tax=Actinokineospora sp. TaxID=1872133 RepID=UPI003D6B8FDD